MLDMLLKSLIGWLTLLPVAVVMFFVIDWLTGDGLVFSGRNDERKRAIKHQSIVGSWTMVLSLFIVNFVSDFFQLYPYSPLPPMKYPELFYLIAAIACYFLFYIINSRRMRA